MTLNVPREKHLISPSHPDLLDSGIGFLRFYKPLEWAAMILSAQSSSFSRNSRFPYHADTK